MVNPVKLTKIVETKVSRSSSKKYYRFRKTRFYGGCATIDCLGCNLRCAYCWAQKKVWTPEKFGEYYTPREVSEKLNKMNLSLVRVSGGEPTICKKHLLELISFIPENKLFILETNGIVLNEDCIKELSNFKNIHIRVSLKGVDEKIFEQITGADGKFFKNQLVALELLKNYKIKSRAAILVDLFSEKQIESLGILDLEYETLITYPFIIKSLKKRDFKINS